METTTTAAVATLEFSADTVLGPPELTVRFSIISGPGDISAALWDFGDQQFSTDLNPSHTYTSANVYDVSLRVIGGDDLELEKTKVAYIRVVQNAPVASFTASATSGPAPLTVTFTDTSTGGITSREWDFGDGASAAAGETTVEHTYSAAGVYTVKLTVAGEGGVSTELKQDCITVEEGRRTWAVSGRITGAGELTGIDVSLSGNDLSRTIKTDGDGGYRFGGIPAGRYRITPIREGSIFDPAGQEVTVLWADVTVGDITVTSAGPTVAGLTIDPQRASADGNMQVTITAQVSRGSSAISSVAADLTEIGSDAAAPLNDGGTAGDAAAGDGVYTLITTVAESVQPGLKALRVTATDTEGLASSAVEGLNVYKEYHDNLNNNEKKQYTLDNDLAGQTLLFTLTQEENEASGVPRLASLPLFADESECAPQMQVISPGGDISQGQSGGASQSTVEITDAAAGQWTCEVSSSCDTAVSYGLESSISGSGLVTGRVVDSRTGQGITGASLMSTAGVPCQTDGGLYTMQHPSGVYTLSATMPGFVTAGKSLTVSAGGSTEMNFALDNTTETGGCFLTGSLGQGQKLQALRKFRDNVLAGSERGRGYIRLYYRYSPEVLRMMMRDRRTAAAVYGCVAKLLPLAETMLAGGEALPDTSQGKALQGCLELLRRQASPGLAAEIEALLNALRNGGSFNRLLR